MKILMLAKGTWIHSRRLLKWLLDSGQEVIFVDHERPAVEESTRYNYIPYPGVRGKRLYSWFGKPISDCIAQWTVEMQLRWIRWRSKADVVHLHWVDKRAYQVVRAKSRPLVLSVLGSDINRYFVSEFSFEDRQKIGEVLKKADLVLVDAEDMIEKCQKLAGGRANIKFFPVGIDTKKFSVDYEEKVIKWRNKLGIESDALVLISIRAIAPVYNHHLVLEAFSRATPHFKRPAYLILKEYNANNLVYKNELQTRIRKLDLEPRVRWIQEYIPDSEIPILYALADLIINFPAYDAFPVSFVEAAASASPVISCNLPAYKNTFAEDFFRMTEVGNINALSNGLIEFANGIWKPGLNNVEKAREWVQKYYDENVSARNLINIYQELTRPTD